MAARLSYSSNQDDTDPKDVDSKDMDPNAIDMKDRDRRHIWQVAIDGSAKAAGAYAWRGH